MTAIAGCICSEMSAEGYREVCPYCIATKDWTRQPTPIELGNIAEGSAMDRVEERALLLLAEVSGVNFAERFRRGDTEYLGLESISSRDVFNILVKALRTPSGEVEGVRSLVNEALDALDSIAGTRTPKRFPQTSYDYAREEAESIRAKLAALHPGASSEDQCPKDCSICHERKPASEFSQMFDGSQCKECRKWP